MSATKKAKKSAAKKAAKKSAAKKAAKKPASKKKAVAKQPAAAKKKPAKKATAKKPTAKKPTAKRAKAKAKPTARKPRPRRDATGHLDPAYARDLRRLSRENVEHDDDRAFLVGERRDDALADELGKEFVETVTSGEDEGIELRDELVAEETGGPFVTTTGDQEFADDEDASNPPSATREPFPKS